MMVHIVVISIIAKLHVIEMQLIFKYELFHARIAPSANRHKLSAISNII
jgi:hypothetical protein